MTHEDVARWLDAYIDAWTTYDPGAIGALFTEGVEYRYHPWDAPVRGRAAVVAAWLGSRDEPGTYTARYEPWAVEGHRAVATGTSDYADSRGTRRYHNAFLLEFDGAGQCSSFTELFIEER